MDLLERINNCKEEELTSIIDVAIQDAVANAPKKERLGFPENGSINTKTLPYKGFISTDSRIKYGNKSLYSYTMKTTDYIYGFAKFIKKNNIKNKGNLVKYIEDFINAYFGKSDGIDRRDDYFTQILWQTTNTDEEFFEKTENIEIGDLKGKNLAMCTERAAVAQNLLSLFGIESYYCIGCVNNNGKDEAHCFNIARTKEGFALLDYSLPVGIFKNGELVGFAPFQGDIDANDIENILVNGISKEFPSYEYVLKPNSFDKVVTNKIRTYIVGKLHFEHTINR